LLAEQRREDRKRLQEQMERAAAKAATPSESDGPKVCVPRIDEQP
jgi:hypothetical protein